jgi:hypothetical protein
VTLQFIEVAIEELAPERLRGYGEVPRNLFQLLAAGLRDEGHRSADGFLCCTAFYRFAVWLSSGRREAQSGPIQKRIGKELTLRAQVLRTCHDDGQSGN